MRTIRSAVAILLLSLSAYWGVPPPLLAQDQAPAQLNIEIIDGEGAINNIKQRTAREPVVQVTDENHKPVAGALVLFTLPQSGASGTFANAASTLSVTTDAEGKAVAQGLKPNAIKGRVEIKVDASYRDKKAQQRTITQTNAAVATGFAGLSVTAKVLIIVGVAAAAAAGGAVAATNGGGGRTATPGTVITPGSPTVGPPH